MTRNYCSDLPMSVNQTNSLVSPLQAAISKSSKPRNNISTYSLDKAPMKHDYPEYPSVKAMVELSRYMEAIEALEGVRHVFCDGESILLPEAEVEAIEMLRSRFNAATVYGQAMEYEFATRARNEGVPAQLLRLGQAVRDLTGQDAQEMVRAALDQPSATLLAWSTLYRSSMSPH